MTQIPETEFHKLFKASLQGHTLIVRPEGDSISFRDSDVEKELVTLLKIAGSDSIKSLIVDLGNSDYFGTVVIGAFNQLGAILREKGSKVALCECSENMRSIIKVMNLDRIWPIYDSLKEALNFVND